MNSGRSHLWVVALGVLGAVAVVGVLLWALGGDSSKVTALGTTLLGSALVGTVLVVFERGLAARSEAVERELSLLPAPEPATDPATDDGARLTTGPGPKEGLVVSQTTPPKRRHYAVEYEGWVRDRSRIDAFQERGYASMPMREYFQFFTATVPGMDVLIAEQSPDVTAGSFRRALADLAVDQVKEAIAQGDAPRPDDPTKAIELRPDPEEATRRARRNGGDEYREGEVIAEFEM